MAKKKHKPGQGSFAQFGSVPSMPEGYYSGDQPNPTLRRFVETHSKPFDAITDTYAAKSFDEPILTTKANAIYNMHTYWSKKPHDAIRQYIRHFTTAGDVVLDPFSGSGSTALAALIEGRKAIAIDRSPAATFITKHYCTPIAPDALRRAYETLCSKVSREMEWLYSTRCDRCDGDATTSYTVYSQVFQCPRCLGKVPLFDCVEVDGETAAGKSKKVNVCPSCHAKGQNEIIRSQSEKFGSVPVMVSYLCRNGCKPQRSSRLHNDSSKKKRDYFNKYDLGKINEIESADIPYWWPKHFDMTGFNRYQRDALFYYGVKEVADLFTKRNLWALAAFRKAILEAEDVDLRVLLTWASLKCSRLMRYCNDGIGRILSGTYYIPQIGRDSHVPSYINEAFGDIFAHHSEKQHLLSNQNLDAVISTQDVKNMSAISANTIDYIFTDPPYADKEQYGELNFVWEAWLGFDTNWHGDEIIVNETRSRTQDDWADMMRRAMSECFRVLKPGRWLSLCYHDSSEGTWSLVQDIMAEAGFIVSATDRAIYIDTTQKTHNQIHADKVTKRDLVLNFRKPKPGEWQATQVFIPDDVDVPTFNELGSQVIKNYLAVHPGATKDRIYDAVVSCMVRKGQMEAHDFDALLRSVAEEVQQPVKEDLLRNKEPNLWGSHVQSRWYLKETADLMDQAEQAKEGDAAKRLLTVIVEHLKKKPELEGVHYSDLFEKYLPVHDKPRRLLNDWLPEFFIKTASGTWRLPDEEESQLLAKLREAGTLRRIKRFANALIDGVPVRDKDRPGSDVDLLDWLRQCRRAGLYEEGRAIFEKGGLNSASLTDQQQIEAEDDYRICVRRGSTEEAKPKRKAKKKQSDGE
jgi:DNA modification methylase